MRPALEKAASPPGELCHRRVGTPSVRKVCVAALATGLDDTKQTSRRKDAAFSNAGNHIRGSAGPGGVRHCPDVDSAHKPARGECWPHAPAQGWANSGE